MDFNSSCNEFNSDGAAICYDDNALFSDMTKEYVIPQQPEEYEQVTIRFRTGKGSAESVFFVAKDKKRKMYLAESNEEFDYYQYGFLLENRTIRYHFEVHIQGATKFYDQRGVVFDIQDYYSFKLVPGFKTPDWAKGAVMYQIYIDRFLNGDISNDVLTNEYYYVGGYVEQVKDWNKIPALMGVREFYGGDLQGVLDKLDYLQELGVEVIYFNPLFVSPSNHKYDSADYDHIDPHIGKIVSDEGELLAVGNMENRFATKYMNRITNTVNLEATNTFFVQVVEEIHKRGMKVILDGVFNHCGSFNHWLDRERIYEGKEGFEKGAYIQSDSPYHDYFGFTKDAWPYNTSYEGWWGHDTLPKLNFEGSDTLYQDILRIAQKWVSAPYNVDGWRLDVAADLGHSPQMNHRFWKDFRAVVKRANPEAIIIAEHYGDPTPWVEGKEWDTVMNYDAFMEPVTWFLTGMQKHSDDFREDLLGNADSFWGAMRHHMAHFTTASMQTAMNQLSNHDHSRFLTRTNHTVGRIETLGAERASQGIDKAVMREAAAIQMTWVGAPTIYYGDEAGLCGFTDPDNRRGYPWGREDQDLIGFHRELIRIHKENTALQTGSIKYLGGDYNHLSYGRFDKNAAIVVLINNNATEYNTTVRLWHLEIPREATIERILLSDQTGYSLESKEYVVNQGKTILTLPPKAVVILRYEKNNENKTKKMLQFL